METALGENRRAAHTRARTRASRALANGSPNLYRLSSSGDRAFASSSREIGARTNRCADRVVTRADDPAAFRERSRARARNGEQHVGGCGTRREIERWVDAGDASSTLGWPRDYVWRDSSVLRPRRRRHFCRNRDTVQRPYLRESNILTRARADNLPIERTHGGSRPRLWKTLYAKFREPSLFRAYEKSSTSEPISRAFGLPAAYLLLHLVISV